MKKFYFLFLCAGMLQAQTFQNNTATTEIDAVQRSSICGNGVQPGVEMSDIVVTTPGTITNPSKITISLAIDASWLGDVVVELICPQGEAITLIRRIGANVNSSCGDSSRFIPANIMSFNSENTDPIDVSAAFFVPVPGGNFAPTYGTAKFPKHHPGDMATFLTGKVLNGSWRLIVYDYGKTEITQLNSWQMQIANGATLSTSQAGVFGSEISLKQNPVVDVLSLDVNPDFNSLNLEIYDATGKLVKQETVPRNAQDIKLDTSYLASGMYILVPIKDGEKRQGIKFVKK